MIHNFVSSKKKFVFIDIFLNPFNAIFTIQTVFFFDFELKVISVFVLRQNEFTSQLDTSDMRMLFAN